jgi:adenosylcobinamide-phosphate synthase
VTLAGVLGSPWPWPLLQAVALALAWALDRRFGEPPNAWHPVAWFGRPAWALLGGVLAWGGLVLGAAALAWALQAWLVGQPGVLAAPLLAMLLKPLFAARMLTDEVAAVEAALQQDLAAGRARLAWLVSRDVSRLDAAEVRESAIETLAENLNDSVVAPLVAFALFGLPGAVLYRAANTLDAMWGYRGDWEWAGKWAARADDVLSWPTARLTAALLRPAWRPAAWARLRREARVTPSPNGGWPMGAMALRLGVRLRKPGVYALHAAARPPLALDVQRAIALAQTAGQRGVHLLVAGLLGRAAATLLMR